MRIPVIDLFAGPGGLSEGFEDLLDKNGDRIFNVVLSIEKDKNAWQTLLLRSFYRLFKKGNAPDVYYAFLRSNKTDISYFEELLQSENDHIKQKYEIAKNIAWNATLGKTSDDSLDKRIKSCLNSKNNWILIGGPPCQAYSLVGRSRNKGIDPNDPRVYLYREYYRILAVHNPSIFVMENVKGLLSAKVEENSIFEQIINDVKNPVAAFRKLSTSENLTSDCSGYYIFSFVKHSHNNVANKNEETYEFLFHDSDFVIKSEDYGIPQTRHRVILLGIRKDLLKSYNPLILDKVHVKINAGDVLTGLPEIRSGLSKESDSYSKWVNAITRFDMDKLLDSVDKDLFYEIKNNINSIINNNVALDRGNEFIGRKTRTHKYPDWFIDKKLGGACNHSSRSHIAEDLHRYLFISSYGKLYGRSPKLNDFPDFLLPMHRNANKKSNKYKFADRFRVQIENQPSKTITSHISKDGHYFIHFDPSQCRSLTVREAARLQTFPDNYYFCGPRTSQYIQVGNAVPPILAKKIAYICYQVLIGTESPNSTED